MLSEVLILTIFFGTIVILISSLLFGDTKGHGIFDNIKGVFKTVLVDPIIYTIQLCIGKENYEYLSSKMHSLSRILLYLVPAFYVFLAIMVAHISYTYIFPFFNYNISVLTVWIFLYGCAVLSFFILFFSDPGVVTEKNLKYMEDLYPYDHVLYHPSKICSTCHYPKPARSKHCSTCNRCVYRFDHHCLWVHNDIGLLNYNYFLLFVVIHIVLCATYFYYLLKYFSYYLYEQQVLSGVYSMPSSDEKTEYLLTLLLTFLRHHVHYVFLMFFTLILAISLVLFLLLHLYQACFNITSNENAKRQAIRYNYYANKPLGWIFVLFAWNSSCTPVNMYVEQI